jgi:streptogramin lyase
MKTLAAALLLATVTATAQMQMPSSGQPLASPAAMAAATVGGKSVVIHYNQPSMRGRKIMGDLVPYGQVWRTGANPATSFVTTGDLVIGDLKVPAGKYTLYTLPSGDKPWQLIVNKQTGQWGTEYSQPQDLGRTPMHFAKLPSPQEVMSISFEKTTAGSTELHVKWETTDEWVKVEAAK